MLKDPLVRRFVSASFFAAAFVWVAVRYFNVEADLVWALFGVSFLFVGAMIVAGLVFAPAIRLFRAKPTTLLRPEAADKQPEATGDRGR